jgi:hypothetical protein
MCVLVVSRRMCLLLVNYLQSAAVLLPAAADANPRGDFGALSAPPDLRRRLLRLYIMHVVHKGSKGALPLHII